MRTAGISQKTETFLRIRLVSFAGSWKLQLFTLHDIVLFVYCCKHHHLFLMRITIHSGAALSKGECNSLLWDGILRRTTTVLDMLLVSFRIVYLWAFISHMYRNMYVYISSTAWAFTMKLMMLSTCSNTPSTIRSNPYSLSWGVLLMFLSWPVCLQSRLTISSWYACYLFADRSSGRLFRVYHLLTHVR